MYSVDNERLRYVLGEKIYHPTVQAFFDRYEETGGLREYGFILEELSPGTREMVLSSQRLQVHKEKALWPVFVASRYKLDLQRAVRVGAVVEMLWGLSVIVDDMLDNDTRRNNEQSEWVRLGKETMKRNAFEALGVTLKYAGRHIGPDASALAYNYIKMGVDSVGEHKFMGLDTSENGILGNYIERDSFHTTYPVEVLVDWKKVGLSRECKIIKLGLTLFNQAGQIANDMSDMQDSASQTARLSDLREGRVTIAIKTLYGILSSSEQRTFKKLFGRKNGYSQEEYAFIRRATDNSIFWSLISRRIIDTYKRAYELLAPHLLDEDLRMVANWINYKTEKYVRY